MSDKFIGFIFIGIVRFDPESKTFYWRLTILNSWALEDAISYLVFGAKEDEHQSFVQENIQSIMFKCALSIMLLNK